MSKQNKNNKRYLDSSSEDGEVSSKITRTDRYESPVNFAQTLRVIIYF